MAKIIDFPNVEKLKEEVKALREEIIRLAFCHDDLIAHEAIRIEAKYNEEFGMMEYKAMNLNLTVKKLKEEKSLVESFITRDEPVDFYYISNIVSSKFTKVEKNLRDKLTLINNSRKSIETLDVSSDKFFQTEKSYTKIIGKINPVINPNISLEEWDLYKDAIAAFTNYDSDFLLEIADMVDGNYDNDYYLWPSDSLYAEKIRLEAAIVAIKEAMDEMSMTYPINLKKYLVDSKEHRNKKEVLKKRISSLKDAKRSLEEDLKILLEAYND